MKISIIIALVLTTLIACVPPIKPVPPIGCSYNNAVLVNSGNSCYWVYMNCGY